MTTDDEALIEAYLRYLRGEAELPEGLGIDPQADDGAKRMFELLDAVTDVDRKPLPDLKDDPVARALGLAPVEQPAAAAVIAPGGIRSTSGRRGVGRRRFSGRGRGLAGVGSAAAAVALAVILNQVGIFGGGTPAGALTTGRLTSDCATTFRGNPVDVAAGRPHVVVAAVWGATERSRFEEVLTRFVKETGITVSFATDPKGADREIDVTLPALSKQGCAPDVALLPQPGLMARLAKDGHLVPIDDIAKDELERNYNPAWRKLGRVGDGPSYGVWFKAANKSIIWYNANAFRSAGIASPPTDWQGLKDVAGKLLAAGITPFAIGGGQDDGWVLTDWFENIYLATAGGESYDRLAAGEIPWTDVTVKHALTLLAEIFARPEWLADTTTGTGTTNLNEAIAMVFGDRENPEAAMLFQGDFLANFIAGTPSKVGSDARFFPFPMIGPSEGAVVPAASTNLGETGGDVAVLMKHTDAGEQLIRFLASPEAAEPWVEKGGFISPNLSVDLDDYPDADTRRAAEDLINATDLRFDLSDLLESSFASNPESPMWRILQDFLATPTDVEGTVQRLEAAYRAAVGS